MKFQLLFLFLFFNLALQAGDIRGGDIHIQQYTAYSVQANIHINLIVHSGINQITICWGDGSCDVLGNPQVVQNAAIDTKTLHFFWTHQYDEHGFYEITVEECCWANDIFNMNLVAEQAFVLETSFKLLDPQIEPYNVMPLSTALPVSTGNLNEFLVYDSFVNIPNGDQSTFEICEVDVDNYFLLEEIFTQPDNFIFDPLTGGFTWFDPPAPGYFIVKVCITTTRNGLLISESSRDILIAIHNTVGVENPVSSKDFVLKCYPNPVQDFIHFEYHLKEKSTVEIDLIDALGKKIKTLHAQGDEGKNLEILDIRDLSEGCYFIKMKAGDQVGFFPFLKK